MPFRKIAGFDVPEIDEYFSKYDSEGYFETFGEVDPERFSHSAERVEKAKKILCRSYEWDETLDIVVDAYGTDVNVSIPIHRKSSLCKTKPKEASFINSLEFIMPINESPRHAFHKYDVKPVYKKGKMEFDYKYSGYPEYGKRSGYPMKAVKNWGLNSDWGKERNIERMSEAIDRMTKVVIQDISDLNLFKEAVPLKELMKL